MNRSLLCIDIGNTHTHFGVVSPAGVASPGQVRTREIDDPQTGLPTVFPRVAAAHPDLAGVAFCSVVPAATERLAPLLARGAWSGRVHRLTCESNLGVPIHYPKPTEIGPDRLANAAGARALHGGPAVVIDMGTAVTFDIVSQKNGYEGGIIAPGVEVMRRYLHEQTALLPLLDDNIEVKRPIGQSTLEAMRIGTVIGFGGMIQALLDAVLGELQARGEGPVRVFATGGSGALLRERLRTPFELAPDITLVGLAHAWHLNQPART